MNPFVELIKPHLPGGVRTPLAALASYLRGRKILSAYSKHYRRARAAYPADGAAAGRRILLPKQFGVRMVEPNDGSSLIDLPSHYQTLVQRVAADAHARFERSAGLTFFPALPPGPIPDRTADLAALADGAVIIMRLVDPATLGSVQDLARTIVPELERRVFGSHAIVDRVFVYRSPVSRARPRASWLWHYDNYPREILKVMIYLTEVTADTAPFEYLRHTVTGNALPGPSLSPNYGDSRIGPAAIARYRAQGYEPHAVTGPPGSMVVFDNNIVHRANLAARSHRDVLVLQVRPAVVAGLGGVDQRWTGSFQHSGFNLDPHDIAL